MLLNFLNISSHALLLITIGHGVFCHADIVYNSNNGTGDHSSLAGPNFQIPASLGTQPGNGSNLFHSFESFNLSAGESATFTNVGATAPVNNIISRVTGGNRSLIDGLLQTQFTNGQQPDLYFFNPAGVLFGPNSQLDVQGSFYVSTANYLKLSDGTLFHANSSSEDILLTSAPPEAFGFVNAVPNSIIFKGQEEHLLEVKEGKKFSIIGGDISIRNSAIYAREGQINLVSVRSSGDIKLNSLDLAEPLPFESLPLGGDIHIQQDNNVNRSRVTERFSRDTANIDTGTEGQGQVFIRGGQLIAQNANLLSSSDNTIQLQERFHMQGGRIRIIGLTPELTINSPDIKLENAASIFIRGPGSSPIENNDNLIIDTRNLTLIGADNIDGTFNTQITGILTDVKIDTEQLLVRNGGSIEARGGNLNIQSSQISLNGINQQGAFSQIQTTSANGRNPGILKIDTDSLHVTGGARIATGTKSNANGGPIIITASEMIILDGDGVDVRDNFSILSEVQGEVNETVTSGKITINTNRLLVNNGATISAKTFESGIGGNIVINAQSVDLLNGGKITSEGGGTGKSGSITLGRKDNINRLNLSKNSRITVETNQNDAGEINLSANFLNLEEHSEVTTSAASGEGKGGNITINTPDLLILNSNSKVEANAQDGVAGNITININKGGAFLQTSNSIIEASNEKKINGNIEINAPDTDITRRFKPLSSRIVDASTILQKPCAQRFYSDAISFVNQAYEVLPDSPYALRTALSGPTLSVKLDQLATDSTQTSRMNPGHSLNISCRQTTQ